ncbi:MAG TPA: serine/threonine-protein kinase [Kofleriaceae bacterium]|nr:serine/threonine-protein kinase [Kofleriaceae bacterium]
MPTEFPDHTTDVTFATEVNELPGALVDAHGSQTAITRAAEEDRTVFADPVEQAILVDRTRTPRHTPAQEAPAAREPTGANGVSAQHAARPAIDPRAETMDAMARPDAFAGLAADGMFGNYRLVAPLVANPLGTRFLAEHASLGFPVAIKMLQPELAGDTHAENRFFAEAMVTARIAHPGVPMVLDFGYDQRRTAYLAMEYLEGETLAAHLAAGSLFSLEQVLEIGAQSAGILAAAHASDVVHQDIRCDSIHIGSDASEPSGLRIKLLDFGVAGAAREQREAIDPRADVYGLGCVLYQLLTGRPPFTGSAEEVAHARRTQDPPPPGAHRSDIPPLLDSLVHRMVARRPQDRPASAADVERQLRTLLVGCQLVDAASPSSSRVLRMGWQSVRQRWQRLRPVLVATWHDALAMARQAAVRRPVLSVACITAALVLGAVGVYFALV